MLLNRLFTIIAKQQPEKRQEDKWLCRELTAGAYELNFPTSMLQLEFRKEKRKKKNRKTEKSREGKKETDDDDDEKEGGGKKRKKSGTVVKASLNAIGVKSQTESRLH